MSNKITLLEKIRRFGFSVYKKEETKIHELKSILWECTLKCNLNCGHCGSDCKVVSQMPDADENLLYKALEDIKTVYEPSRVMVGITGGEPLMRKDLPQIIRHISDMGYPVGIVSNGFAMTPEKFTELIGSGLKTMTISLDGLEKEHNELRNNPLSYKHAYIAIKNAATLVNQAKGKIKFNFDVVTCVHPGNIDTLAQIRDSLVDIGVKDWRIFSIFPSGRADDTRFNLSSEQYKKMMDFIEAERKKNLINVAFSCEGWLGNYEIKVRPSYYFCRAGITSAGIFVDGKVGGCISVRSKDFIAGDLHEKSFIDIWENGFDLHRDRKWAKKGKCENCKEWKNCLGNGLHLYSSVNSEPAICSFELLS